VAPPVLSDKGQARPSDAMDARESRAMQH